MYEADRAFEELKNFAKAQYQRLNCTQISIEETTAEEAEFEELIAKAFKYNIPFDKHIDKDEDEFFKLEEDIEEREDLLKLAAKVGVEHNYDDYDPEWLRTRIRVAEEEPRINDNDGHRSDYYASIYIG